MRKGIDLSGEDVVKVLAERDGFENVAEYLDAKWPIPFTKSFWGGTRDGLGESDDTLGREIKPLPDYLHSRDALAGVLGKLTDAEWRNLIPKLCEAVGGENATWWEDMRKILTLPPEQLASAVAEAIVVCRLFGT